MSVILWLNSYYRNNEILKELKETDQAIDVTQRLADENAQKAKEKGVNTTGGGGGNTPSTTPTRSHSSDTPTQTEDKRTLEQKLQDFVRQAQARLVELLVSKPQNVVEMVKNIAEKFTLLNKISKAKTQLSAIDDIRTELANPAELNTIEDHEARLSYLDARIKKEADAKTRKILLDERKATEDVLEKMKNPPKVAPVLGQQKTLADYDSAIQYYTDKQRNADVSNITELQKVIDRLNKQKDALMLGTQIPEMQKALDDLGTRGTKEYTLKIQSVGIDAVKDKIKELNSLLEDTTLNLPDDVRKALEQQLQQWKGTAEDLEEVEKKNALLTGLQNAAGGIDQLAQSFAKLNTESKGLAVAMQSVSLAATLTQIIAGMIAANNNSKLGIWEWIAGLAAGTAAVVGSITALKGVAFAEGGIVRGPTLGLVGEYPGASSNPEVIAPLNKLRSLIGEDSGYGEVHFKIAGPDLEGVLKRRQKLHNRR